MPDEHMEGINIPEIMQKIENKYGLEKLSDTQSDALRQKIKSILKKMSAEMTDEEKDTIKTNLWEKSKFTRGKRTEHYFDDQEVTRLLNLPELDRYIKVTLLLDANESTKYLEREKLATTWNQLYPKDAVEAVESAIRMQRQGENPAYVSYGEAHAKALGIMVEALFLRYFEPIDIERLRLDMEIQGVMQSVPDQYTPETVAACQRLMNPQGYCKPRKEENPKETEKKN